MKNVTDSPQDGYTERVYGDGTRMVAYSAAGAGQQKGDAGKQAMMKSASFTGHPSERAKEMGVNR